MALKKKSVVICRWDNAYVWDAAAPMGNDEPKPGTLRSFPPPFDHSNTTPPSHLFWAMKMEEPWLSLPFEVIGP